MNFLQLLRMLEVGSLAPKEAHVFDSGQFNGLIDGYWIVSLAWGNKADMLALCTKLKPQADCYVKNIGKRAY